MVELLHEGPPVITDRQRQVIELIADGCSNDEVARRLGISPRTAKAHSDVLRQKLGCARRRQIPRAYRSLTGASRLADAVAVAGVPASIDNDLGCTSMAIGVDTASIDFGQSKDFIVHQVAMGANVPGLENIANLDRLPERGAWVIALPMKIAGGSGAPLRIVAVIPTITARR